MIRGLKQSAKEHHPHTHSCNAEMKKMEEDTAGYKKKKKKKKYTHGCHQLKTVNVN